MINITSIPEAVAFGAALAVTALITGCAIVSVEIKVIESIMSKREQRASNE